MNCCDSSDRCDVMSWTHARASRVGVVGFLVGPACVQSCSVAWLARADVGSCLSPLGNLACTYAQPEWTGRVSTPHTLAAEA